MLKDQDKEEKRRLRALAEYGIMDTEDEIEYDELTELASIIAGMPIALISLVDDSRQWFKSKVGLSAPETDRAISFCTHAIEQDELFEVKNANLDPRFKDNPLVTSDPDISYYGGFPLKNPQGHNLGTLCVIDTKENSLSLTQKRQLQIISNQVIRVLELRKKNRQEKYVKNESARLFDLSIDLICIGGLDGYFKNFNPAFEEAFGYTREELLKIPFVKLVHPEDVEDTMNEVDLLAKGKKTVEFRNRFLAKNGKYHYLEWRITPDVENQLLYSVARDVTKQVERSELKEAEYQVINDTLFKIELSLDHKILNINDNFSSALGYASSELLGRKYDTIIFDTNRDCPKELFDKITAEGRLRETSKFKSKQGVEVWVEGTFVLVESKDRASTILHLSSDTTELTEAQKRVNDLEFAINQSSIVAITDNKGKITFANDKFCEISKYPIEELIGKDHRIINSGHHPKEFFKDLWGTISSGKVWRGDVKNRNKKGGFYWVDTTIVPFLRDGIPYQYVALRKDISEKVQAKEDMRRNIKNLDEFAYVVSHDLKSPLRAISTLSEFIEEDLGDQLDGDVKENFRLLRSRTRRMQNLITDILDYSKIGKVSAHKVNIDLQKFVDSVIESASVPKEFTITKDIQVKTVSFESVFLEQILLNLITNAVKYNNRKAGELNISARLLRNKLEMTFQDNGIGIDPAYHHKIFEVFQTLDSKKDSENTGIGLSTVKKILDFKGGEISVESELGKGSVFKVLIPA